MELLVVELVCASARQEFMHEHQNEVEQPWVDIRCTAWLNGLGFPYACQLLGIYRDEDRSPMGSLVRNCVWSSSHGAKYAHLIFVACSGRRVVVA